MTEIVVRELTAEEQGAIEALKQKASDGDPDALENLAGLALGGYPDAQRAIKEMEGTETPSMLQPETQTDLNLATAFGGLPPDAWSKSPGMGYPEHPNI